MENSVQLFDTHAHHLYKYRGKSFYEQHRELLRKSYEEGVVKVVDVAIDFSSNEEMLREFAEYPRPGAGREGLPEVGIAAGEHPLAAGRADPRYTDEQKMKMLAGFCSDQRVCAIKTGLDYSRIVKREESVTQDSEGKADDGAEIRRRQQERFRSLLRLSREKGLPLVLHIRDAYEDALQILEKESLGEPYRGVVHCFTQGPDCARKFIEKGFILGIGGKVTYEENRDIRKTVAEIPLKYLVLETDCPLIPVCGRKKSGGSADLLVVAQTVAALKEISFAQVAEETFRNSVRLFERTK